MAMRKQYTLSDLKSMSRAQLEVVCRNRVIEIDSKLTDDGVRSLILEDQFDLKTPEATASAEDKTPDPAPEPAPEPKPESVPDKPMPTLKAPNGNDRVWFRVMAGSQAHEKADVFAALNGESILVKRNHWVKLKTKFLKVFEDAIQTEVYIEDDEPKIRHVPRFNYMVRSLSEGIPEHERRAQ